MSALDPYLGAIKAAAVVALLLGCFGAGVHVEHSRLTAQYTAEKLALQQADEKELLAAIAKNDADLKDQQANAKKASTDYANAIAALNRKYAAAVQPGSLRVSSAVCHQPAATAETASAGRSDDATAATVALPPITASDILALMREADGMSEQLRALQAWIRLNGLAP